MTTADAYLWETTMDFEADILTPSYAKGVIDSVDADVFLMEIEIPMSSSTEGSSYFDTYDDFSRRNSLGMTCVKLPEYNYDPPHSPCREQRESYASEVTPEQAKSDYVKLPTLAQLKIQYDETLKKLAKSMRRSDVTRSVIKRQRKVLPSLSFDSATAPDFFTGPRFEELEKERKRLLRLIQTPSN
jgi:hypothetical protein